MFYSIILYCTSCATSSGSSPPPSPLTGMWIYYYVRLYLSYMIRYYFIAISDFRCIYIYICSLTVNVDILLCSIIFIIHIYTHDITNIHIYIYTYMYTYIHNYIRCPPSPLTGMWIHSYVRLYFFCDLFYYFIMFEYYYVRYIYIYIYICMYVYIYIHILVCYDILMCVYIYTHIYIHQVLAYCSSFAIYFIYFYHIISLCAIISYHIIS